MMKMYKDWDHRVDYIYYWHDTDRVIYNSSKAKAWWDFNSGCIKAFLIFCNFAPKRSLSPNHSTQPKVTNAHKSDWSRVSNGKAKGSMA